MLCVLYTEPSQHFEGSQCLLFFVNLNAKMAGVLNVLEKLHLEHLFENFQREKITLDQISKLSSEQTECLGVKD